MTIPIFSLHCARKQNFGCFDLIDEKAAANIFFSVCIRYYSFYVWTRANNLCINTFSLVYNVIVKSFDVSNNKINLNHFISYLKLLLLLLLFLKEVHYHTILKFALQPLWQICFLTHIIATLGISTTLHLHLLTLYKTQMSYDLLKQKCWGIRHSIQYTWYKHTRSKAPIFG